MKDIQQNTDNRPLQIMMVDGGLASQITKFVVGSLLEEKMDVTVKYDLSWFEHCGKDTLGKENRNYCLNDVFEIDIDVATTAEIKEYRDLYYYNHSKCYQYDDRLLRESCHRYVDGYFAHYTYFSMAEDIIKNKLVFKLKLSDENLQFEEQISLADTPVAIHIRRGDFVGSVHEVLQADYYQRGIEVLLNKTSASKPHFFVFSNDMQWVKDNVRIQYPVTYVEGNNNDEAGFDMYLMFKCKHFIISNSGFGFWAAWLNSSKDKVVIAPDKWFNEKVAPSQEFLALIEGHDRGVATPPEWFIIPT